MICDFLQVTLFVKEIKTAASKHDTAVPGRDRRETLAQVIQVTATASFVRGELIVR
jgi:hypothetical protein